MNQLIDPQIKQLMEDRLHTLHESLPLAGVTVVRVAMHYSGMIDGEVQYVAPTGKAFRMTGEFYYDSDNSDIADWGPPIASKQKLLREVAETPRFQQLLELAGGDHDKVISFMQEIDPQSDGWFDDDEDIVDFTPEDQPGDDFIGKRLVIRRANDEAGQPSYELCVKGEIDAWAEDALMPVELPISSQSEVKEHYLADLPMAFTRWRQAIGRGLLGKCGIEQIDFEDTNPVISLPATRVDTNKLWVPRDVTSMDLAKHRAELAGKELSQDELERFAAAIRREYQGSRFGLADDPLRHFTISQPELEWADPAGEPTLVIPGQPEKPKHPPRLIF
jgi:hypothetical protein